MSTPPPPAPGDPGQQNPYAQPPQAPYGQQPGPPSPYGQQPGAPTPYGQQPGGPSPYGRPGPPAYGQQPGAPSPYGQQPGAPSPYGQQPGVPAYGQQPGTPPPPYGQPPYGQPYPGQPMGGPPPKKRRTGLILGIVGGVIVLFVIAGIVVATLVTGGSSFPEAKYRLTLPKQLLDGKYSLKQDMSDAEGKQIVDEADGSRDARNAKAVVGQYMSSSGGAVVVSGMYGQFKNTEAARRNMLKGAANAQGATVEVGVKDFKPAGSDVTISCQVMTSTGGAVKLTFPMCAWTDGNTGASVGEITTEATRQQPEDVDLEQAAQTAAKIRQEIRKPVE
ncbi:hypothetical protein [Streptomyces tsukubensis]|uniref:Uncharacterized protein n=1 Tax=Streptomyces tsukubensis TaxID=83656 RepID=A0A1V4ACJ1_9ACTN|nr:hypothetical protein [Streptomyces tsukubensis]OON81183.1 hypothetical protein B1H18_07390 [Streptomyces tsukubensis]QFR95703.1 hypothetical protein GBW32_25065 [Streptomyces tsukubensis]